MMDHRLPLSAWRGRSRPNPGTWRNPRNWQRARSARRFGCRDLVLWDAPGECRKATTLRESNGASVTLADAFRQAFGHGFDRSLVKGHKALLTVEQGAQGGFGAMVLHALANEGFWMDAASFAL